MNDSVSVSDAQHIGSQRKSYYDFVGLELSVFCCLLGNPYLLSG